MKYFGVHRLTFAMDCNDCWHCTESRVDVFVTSFIPSFLQVAIVTRMSVGNCWLLSDGEQYVAFVKLIVEVLGLSPPFSSCFSPYFFLLLHKTNQRHICDLQRNCTQYKTCKGWVRTEEVRAYLPLIMDYFCTEIMISEVCHWKLPKNSPKKSFGGQLKFIPAKRHEKPPNVVFWRVNCQTGNADACSKFVYYIESYLARKTSTSLWRNWVQVHYLFIQIMLEQ